MSGSIAPIIAASSAATTAAAAAARKRREAEEEKMAVYKSDDLNGWEFKIVRSTFGKFSSYEAVEKLKGEEARAGWEMVEKFDDHRIRFKRRVEKRSLDAHLDFDPYRTSAGAGGNTKVMLVVGITLVLIGGILLTAFMNLR